MKIFHVQSKVSGRNFYYRTLAALCADHTPEQLGVSKYTLDRFNFDETPGRYENDLVIIQKGLLKGTREIELQNMVSELFNITGKVNVTAEGVIKCKGHVIEYKKGFTLDGQPVGKEEIFKKLS